MVNDSLVGGGFNQPLWKMMDFGKVGMMTFPTKWKAIKAMVPNQQPVLKWYCIGRMAGWIGGTGMTLETFRWILSKFDIPKWEVTQR